MARAESRISIITSTGFIKGLKFVIAILSSLVVLAMVIPTRSLLIRNQQIDQLNLLEDSIIDVSDTLMMILLESYTVQDFDKLSGVVDKFLLDFSNTQDELARMDQGVNLELMEEYLNPRLMEISSRLKFLSDNGALTGYMPIVERIYTIRNRGFQNIEDMDGYVLLTETLDELQFFLMQVVESYRFEIASATAVIEDLIRASIWMINVLIFVILIILILVAILISANSMRRSKLSEESAHKRSENLEVLVRARTSDLEIQNQQLLETRDLLVEREKMAALGQVVAGVAHEVNTPLGVCVTASSFLSGKLRADSEEQLDREELQEIATIIESNIARAANLIQGFKKVAVDESADDIRFFDLVSYLRDDLLPSLSPLLRKKGHKVIIEGPEVCQMHSYPGSIAQIITNLVLNASLHGYGEVRGESITIEISESENRIQIKVADQGVGMDSELESRIFEPFFTTKKEQGGSGLGLMIVYNLVHGRLGGNLKYNTSPGEGTEFIIDIPQDVEG